MRFLFLHRGFPGDFPQLLSYLAADPSHEVVFITEMREGQIKGVKKFVYDIGEKTSAIHHYLRGLEQATWRGQAVYNGARTLKNQGFQPDIIIGQSRWGLTLFMKELFPATPLLCYFDLFANGEHLADDQRLMARTDNLPVLFDLDACDAGVVVTAWQHSQFPAEYGDKIRVIQDGGLPERGLYQQLQLIEELTGCKLPPSPVDYFRLGVQAQNQSQWQDAEKYYRQALALRSDHAEAANYLGVVLKKQGRITEALDFFRQALCKPDYVKPLVNLGITFHEQGDLDQAIVYYRQVLVLQPDHADIMGNLGVALKESGLPGEAIAYYRQALTLKPDSVAFHWNYSQALLLNGEWQEGFAEHEWRKQVDDYRRWFQWSDGMTLWQGENFTGQRLLIHDEQGFGDVLQFCRYIPLVKQRGGTVVLAVREPLLRLLKQLCGADVVIALNHDGIRQACCDLAVPIMSLPLIFGTTPDSIPAKQGYLQADVELIAQCGQKLGQGDFKIGLVWSSDPHHYSYQRKSLKLAAFAPLAAVKGVQFYSLQKGQPAGEINSVPPGLSIIDLSEDLSDFAHTAAYIANLDLVITIDTSIAHLAGALGKPVWTLVPFNACWRYLLNRIDSLWYDSMRLFRQPRRGEWQAVIERVRIELESLTAPWQGEPLPGGTLLVVGETNPGDQLLLASYLTLTRYYVDRIIVSASPSCQRLFAGIPGVEVIGDTELHQVGQYDHVVPMRNLPAIFGRTSLWAEGPYVTVSPDMIRQRGSAFSREQLNVGFFWQGIPAGIGEAFQGSGANIQVVAFPMAINGSSCADYADAAAVMEQMDIVVTNCREAACLALAIGKPIWMVLCGDDCAVLPAHHVTQSFRQKQPGSWSGVLSEVRAAVDRITRRDDAVTGAVDIAGKLAQALEYKEQGQLEQAVVAYQELLAADPHHVTALNNMGVILGWQERNSEAIACQRRILRLKPDLKGIYYNIANAYRKSENLTAAIAYYHRALTIDPNYEDAFNNVGLAYTHFGLPQAAIAAFDRLLQLRPGFEIGLSNKGMPLLQSGQLAEGFKHYEFRLQGSYLAAFYQSVQDRLHSHTKEFGGKRLLIVSEQGFGDTLQFIRYVPHIKQHVGKVILAVPAPLLRIAQQFGADEVIEETEQTLSTVEFDIVMPMMSLPHVFHTTPETIPGTTGYLAADSELAAKWQQRLRDDRSLKVGLVWAGNPGNQAGRKRTCGLQAYASLAAVQGVTFYSLQKGEAAAETPPPGLKLVDWTAELDDFADTAALIANLDLVISIDTSVVHLAGALGKHVWNITPFAAEWRWLKFRTDSIWYQSMRLFRQQYPGDWTCPMTEVAAELQKLISARQSNLTSARSIQLYKDRAHHYFQQQEYEQAIQCYQQVLTVSPQDLDALCNLGVVCKAMGRMEEAIQWFEQALEVAPGDVASLYNTGNLLLQTGRYDRAIAMYRTAVRLKPDYFWAHHNLGCALQQAGLLVEARACFEQALTLSDKHAELWFNLGLVCLQLKDYAAAVSHLQTGRNLSPEHLGIQYVLARAKSFLCDWQDYDQLRPLLIDKALADSKLLAAHPFTVVMLPVKTTPAEQLYFAKVSAQKYRHANSVQDYRHTPQYKEKLRIGYVSADFRNHATAHLIEGLFKRHNRNRFEVFAYSIGRDDGSSFRQSIQAGCDCFRDLHRVHARQIADTIFHDKIDILIDLMGYTEDNCLEAFAYRPAPVQATYLGYPGTLGTDFMDYIITDRVVTPPSMQPYYSETFAYLPNCYQVNNGDQRCGPIPPWQECGLPDGAIVLCGFNNHYKIEPMIFDVWMKIMKQVPGSVLWLLDGPAQAVQNLRNEAAKRGVSPDRLIFAPIQAKSDHLARIRHADLFLDTLYYNGHTTGSDALWAGVPVVTCPGMTFSSRVGASLLRAVGLPELIVPDLVAYENLAVRLAVDPQKLANVKQKLAKNLPTAPLFDTDRFAADLEQLYEGMWEAAVKRSR